MLSVAHLFGGDRVFRIALLGCTGSGKTCLLAALGAASGPEANCHRVLALPGGLAANGSNPVQASDPVTTFHLATETLGQSERAMHAGNQPPATDPSRPPLLAVYQFTASGQGQMTVEVADYSGELLNPLALQANHRQALIALFDACDAVIVLADAPRPGGQAASLTHLNVIKQAFHDLGSSRRIGAAVPVPVALVFTMWDRRVRAGAPAAERDAALTEFRQIGEYQSLIQTLQNVCVSTNVFAASAFGRPVPPVAKEVGDRPPVRWAPADSYGLVEPFVWACAEWIRLEVDKLAAESARLAWWKGWQFRSSQRTAARARRLRERTHSDSPAHSAAKRTVSRASRTATGQFLVASLLGLSSIVSCLFVCAVVGEWLVHDASIRQAEAVLTNPTASEDQYESARNRLDEYARSASYRHRVSKWRLDREQALAQVAKAHAEREDRAWQAVLNAKAEAVRNNEIARYLANYPTGAHTDEARRWLADSAEQSSLNATAARLAELIAKRRTAVADFEATFKRAEDLRDEPGMAAALRALCAFPPAEAGVDTAREKAHRNGVIADLDRRFKDFKANSAQRDQLSRWKPYQRRIEEDIRQFDFKEAAADLAQAEESLPGFGEIGVAKVAFPTRVVERAEAEAAELLKQTAHYPIRRAIGALDKAKENQKFNDLVRDAKHINRLADLRREMVKQHDQILYAKFKANPSVTTATAFQKGALLDTMKPQVKAFEDYCIWLEKPQKLQLVVAIHWGDWADKASNDITVGPVVHTNIPSRTNTQYDLLDQEFEAVPNRPLGFQITVERKTVFVGNKALKAEVTISDAAIDLRAEKKYDVTQLVGEDRGAKVSVQVKGILDTPAIPEWRE